MKKTIISLLVMGFTLLTINACSTIEGMGKDIQKTGQAIEKKAKDKG